MQRKNPLHARRSVVAKRQALFEANNPTARKSYEICKKRNQEPTFILNNGEQGCSTLNMPSNENNANSRYFTSGGRPTIFNHQAATNFQTRPQTVNKKDDRYYSDLRRLESQGTELADGSAKARVLGNSPQNTTVFQKLVVHENSSGHQVSAGPLLGDSNQSSMYANLSQQQQQVKQAGQKKMIMKREVSAGSDKLLISVKPLNKANKQQVRCAQGSPQNEISTTLAAKGLNASIEQPMILYWQEQSQKPKPAQRNLQTGGPKSSFDPQNSGYQQHGQPIFANDAQISSLLVHNFLANLPQQNVRRQDQATAIEVVNSSDDTEEESGEEESTANEGTKDVILDTADRAKCKVASNNASAQRKKKDAGTTMTGEEVGTQTQSFGTYKTHLSFANYDGEMQPIENMTEFLNFYSNTDLFQLTTGDKSNQKINISQQTAQLKSIHAHSSCNIDLSKVVALIVPDRKIFGERQIERTLTHQGFDGERYICLYLKDVVWIHNYIQRDLVRRRRARELGRMTTNGRNELKRRHTPNPKLMRNSNLAPAGRKRLESNTIRQIDDEKLVYNDVYRFLTGLVANGQDKIGKLEGKPLLSVKKLITHPRECLQTITKVIREATQRPQGQTSGDAQTQQNNTFEQQVNIRTGGQPQSLNLNEVTPPKRTANSQLRHHSRLPDSEQYPPTVTLSNMNFGSARNSPTETDQQLIHSQLKPQKFSIVTRVVEQSKPAPEPVKPFSSQVRQRPSTCQPDKRSGRINTRIQQQQSKRKKIPKKQFLYNFPKTQSQRMQLSQQKKQLHEGMQNALVVGQAKVNQQNTNGNHPDLNKSFTSGQALGTQRLASSIMEAGADCSQSELYENPNVSFREVEQARPDKKLTSNERSALLRPTQTLSTLGKDEEQKIDQCNVGLIIIDKKDHQMQLIKRGPQHRYPLINQQSFHQTNSVAQHQLGLNRDNTTTSVGNEILDIFSSDMVLNSKQPSLLHHHQNLSTRQSSNQPLDFNKMLLEGYQDLKKGTLNQGRQCGGNEMRVGVWDTNYETRCKILDPSERSVIIQPGNDGDEKSSLTVNTQELNQIEDKAVTTEQKMQANLYKEFHVMKKLAKQQHSDVVTGTRVKTYSRHPSTQPKAASRTKSFKKEPMHFSELKQNEVHVRQASQPPTEQRPESQIVQLPHQQRVILISKTDPYKPHEPSTEKPRWIVSTSKRAHKERDSSTSLGHQKAAETHRASSNPKGSLIETNQCKRNYGPLVSTLKPVSELRNDRHDCNCSMPQKQQQGTIEKICQSQAFFYRTTRSQQNTSLVTCQEAQGRTDSDTRARHTQTLPDLAIDDRNTINLQKVIDQYYDGDLTLDRLHNGDLHSMQKAQNKIWPPLKQKQHSTHITTSAEVKKEDRSMSVTQPHSTLMGGETPGEGGTDDHRTGQTSKTQTINGSKEIPQPNAKKADCAGGTTQYTGQFRGSETIFTSTNQLQGAQPKKSEVPGQRRKVTPARTWQNQSTKQADYGDNLAHEATSSRQSKISANNSSVEIHTLGPSYLNDQTNEIEKRRSSVQNHQLNVGHLPNYPAKSRVPDNLDRMSTQPIDPQNSENLHQRDTSSASQVLSIPPKTPPCEELIQRYPDEGNGLTNAAGVNTLKKDSPFDTTPKPNNRDLNQVIAVKGDNQSSRDALNKKSAARLLLTKQADSKASAKKLPNQREKSAKREQCVQSPHFNLSPAKAIVTETVQDSINFGVAGERIKEQKRSIIHVAGVDRYRSPPKLSKEKYKIQSAKKTTQKEEYKETLDITRQARNERDLQGTSVDLRTLSRDGSHIISTSLDCQISRGRTPVNMQARNQEAISGQDSERAVIEDRDAAAQDPAAASFQDLNQNLIFYCNQQPNSKADSNTIASDLLINANPNEYDADRDYSNAAGDYNAASEANLRPKMRNSRTIEPLSQQLSKSNLSINLEQRASDKTFDRSNQVRALLSVSKKQKTEGLNYIDSDERWEQGSEQHSSVGGASAGRDRQQFLANAIYELGDQHQQAQVQPERASQSRSVQDIKDQPSKKLASKFDRSPAIREVATSAVKRTNQVSNQISAARVEVQEQVRNSPKSRSQTVKKRRVDSKMSHQYSNRQVKLQLPNKKSSENSNMIFFSVPTVVSNNSGQKTQSPDKRRNFAVSTGHSPSVQNLEWRINKGTPSLGGSRQSSKKQLLSAADRGRSTAAINNARAPPPNYQTSVGSKKKNESRSEKSERELKISVKGRCCSIQSLRQRNQDQDVHNTNNDGSRQLICTEKKKPKNKPGQFVEMKALVASESVCKEGQEGAHGSEIEAKDFKLVDSELNDEIQDEYEDDVHMTQGEMTLSKSPIRIQTTTLNKVGYSMTQLNSIGCEQSLQPADSGINEIYPLRKNTTYGRMLMRPATSSAFPREGIVSYEPIRQMSFGNCRVARIGHHFTQTHDQARENKLHKKWSKKQERYGARDPYVSFLQNGDTGVDSSFGISMPGGSQKIMHHDSQASDMQNAIAPCKPLQSRPKSSIQSFNRVQRELKEIRTERGHSQLLKRNISMNRRKQELLLKGQAEKQKRLQQLAYSSTRSKTQFTTVPVPNSVTTRKHHNLDILPSQDWMPADFDSKLLMIYSQMKRNNESMNLTGFSTQRYPGNSVEHAMQTVFASNLATPEMVSDSEAVHQADARRESSNTHDPDNAAAVVGVRCVSGQNTQALEEALDGSNQHQRAETMPSAKFVTKVITENAKSSKTSKTNASQSFTRQSQTRNSMASVKGLLQLNQKSEHEFNPASSAPEIDIARPPTPHQQEKPQPESIGYEIRQKREKLKQLYKLGRRKATTRADNYSRVRQFSAHRGRPPLGLPPRCAASVLESSLGGANASSQLSFSVLGSSLGPGSSATGAGGGSIACESHPYADMGSKAVGVSRRLTGRHK